MDPEPEVMVQVDEFHTVLPVAPTWVRLAARIVPRLPRGRYRIIQRLSKWPSVPFWMHGPAEVGSYLFRCDLRDAIAREVCFTGRYEPQETALVGTILSRGMTFVDVGANWGYFTLFGASLVGDGGRVVSLEPHPRLFATLCANVARNALRHVTVVPVAAAATTGVLVLSGYDERSDKWGLSKLVERPSSGKVTFQVAATTLDRLLDEHSVGEVDLLKM